ncbi:glycosyltransferase family 4 protein [Vibrio mexicanus]|uniref:glycosyltransferase family 4 protein n=1 Tax=Vibrio mexicanus TaxID=1004326 RepID=UPI00063CC7B1|nr:glycosyltransferase family 4 protein [Vibrio mexicanus]
MSQRQRLSHCLIFDSINFVGGSKIATQEMLRLKKCQNNRFSVVTANKEYWLNSQFAKQENVSVYGVPTIAFLAKCHHGIGFWLHQLFMTVVLAFYWLKLPRIDQMLGSSGPGMDMPLYVLNTLVNASIIQLIHGPVGASRSIGYCLTKANHVFYLGSAKPSIEKALATFFLSSSEASIVREKIDAYLHGAHYKTFVNGLPSEQWPSQCQYDKPSVFWCASLLRWKGLDLLVEVSRSISHMVDYHTQVCFIRPKNKALPVSEAPQQVEHFSWHEMPDNLNEIRQSANVFVSTSHNEPFGLSILEAMAAGMCVVIPRDNAYWDQVLEHNVNCIKYDACDVNSLTNALLYATSDITLIKQVGKAAQVVAQDYQAHAAYDEIACTLCQPSCESDCVEASKGEAQL